MRLLVRPERAFYRVARGHGRQHLRAQRAQLAQGGVARNGHCSRGVGYRPQ